MSFPKIPLTGTETSIIAFLSGSPKIKKKEKKKLLNSLSGDAFIIGSYILGEKRKINNKYLKEIRKQLQAWAKSNKEIAKRLKNMKKER